MRFLLIDSATGNVLDELETFATAEQRRIQVVGMNPALAEYVEIVDADRVVEAYRIEASRARRERQPA